MIARVWNGKVLLRDAEVYQQYLMDTGVTDYRELQGNKGVKLLSRKDEEYAYFSVVTFWNSVEDIKRYAGEDIDKAKYYPKDEEYLVDINYTVMHCDIVYSESQG